MLEPALFKDFSEYWYFVRNLSESHRKLIFDSLPPKNQEVLESSYLREGYVDVQQRNEIDDIIDGLKNKYHYDILDIRVKVLKGKSVYVPAKFWRLVKEYMRRYSSELTAYVTGNIVAIECDNNKDIVLLVLSSEKEE